MKLIVICGFLGSGKTTFLQSFLKRNARFKIGVVMNEISQIDIDGKKLELKDDHFASITNGSIFCACKSDQFVDRLLKLSTCDLDLIIVEASGLANPSSMTSIIEFVQARSSILYQGMITVIGAPTAHKLLSTCEAVKVQIRYASSILLSKCDLASEETITKAIACIKEENSDTVISPMMMGDYDEVIVNNMIPIGKKVVEESSTIKHKKVLFQIVSPTTKEVLHLFLQTINQQVDRIKGFVKIDGNRYFCEYIDDSFHLEEVYSQEMIDLIAVISTNGAPLKQWVKECASKYQIDIELK